MLRCLMLITLLVQRFSRFLNKDMLITVSTLLKDITSVSELCYTGVELCSIMATRRAHCRREESMLH